MFPYTAEEAEWLSAHADRHANDDVAPQDRRSAP
jgi:hypothetical protein